MANTISELYEKYADIIVNEHHSTIQKTVNKIVEKLEEMKN